MLIHITNSLPKNQGFQCKLCFINTKPRQNNVQLPALIIFEWFDLVVLKDFGACTSHYFSNQMANTEECTIAWNDISRGYGLNGDAIKEDSRQSNIGNQNS